VSFEAEGTEKGVIYLSDDSDGFVASHDHLGVVDLDDLAVILVSPSSVVAKALGCLGDIETASESVGLREKERRSD
jgi:hypothetical protein